MYYIDDFSDPRNRTMALIDGKNVIARPLNYRSRTLKQRIVEAYLVFKGDLEAMKFYGQ